MPISRDDLGPFYRDVIAVDPLEPWDAASAAYRLEVLARTLPFPVSGARFVPSNNNDVWRLEAGYLRVAWRGDRSRLGLRDLAREMAALLRALHSWPVPRALAEMLSYPGADPDPLRRAGAEVVPPPSG